MINEESVLLHRLISHFREGCGDDSDVESWMWSYKEMYSIYDIDPELHEMLKAYFSKKETIDG